MYFLYFIILSCFSFVAQTIINKDNLLITVFPIIIGLFLLHHVTTIKNIKKEPILPYIVIFIISFIVLSIYKLLGPVYFLIVIYFLLKIVKIHISTLTYILCSVVFVVIDYLMNLY